ncbi:MAG TPA: response regulator transcription factor [Cyclobacteriaceae bacterium]|nr:response regulator transcription factor [Cyclobacteriaceae bacterium]MCB9238101.1 response regulator transcription factor [Flammeovirgaceae bacterium]MCB0499521.1 response regulator transcription factor [Cyclobacteriaceae bacterium]MCO5272507.1 response regulator transcription factor [Cyclobacteriaceae bacterium]MCW5901575.1 response regulator transcription factor [Cyclobacteriaceae bacterium]
MSARILLVEDDPALGFVIKDNLVHKQYEVTLCEDGEEAYQQFLRQPYDLCILDVMLPKRDGFSLAQSFRAKNRDIPILFVTAKGLIEDKIAGFESGGDDYIVKPFNMEELLYRIEVFLRRGTTTAREASFALGAYQFDGQRITLAHGQEKKTLTQKEAEILKLLYHNKHRVLKRDEILKTIWGDDDYFMGRSLDVFISKLRKYLRHDPSVQIVNYHGVGFRLEIG